MLEFQQRGTMQVWAKCKIIERCKYCDAASHGVHACPKLQKKNENGVAEQAPAK